MRNPNPKIEFSSPEEINSFQEIKLKELLVYLSNNSNYYRKIFKDNHIDIKKVSLKNMTEIPFTTKDDLAKYNDEFLCVERNKIADYVITSGTTSAPISFYLTAKDLDRLAYNEEISLRCAGGTENDIYQLMTTMDKQFMAGLAYFLGVRRMNAGIIRVGTGSPYLQWESIKNYSPTVLIAIPSFIPKLIQYAVEHQIDYKKTSVKSIVCIGEPLRNPDFSLNELGKRISAQWDVKLYSTYAMSIIHPVCVEEPLHGLVLL